MIDSLCALSAMAFLMLSTRWLGSFLWRMQFSVSHFLLYVQYWNWNSGLHYTIRMLKRSLPSSHPLQLLLTNLNDDLLPRLADRRRRTRSHIDSMQSWMKCSLDDQERARLAQEIPPWESLSKDQWRLQDAIVEPLCHLKCRVETHTGTGTINVDPYAQQLVSASSALKAYLTTADPLESDLTPSLSTP